MELKYELDGDGNIVNARFEGLTGCESVTSIKQALGLLQVENPAVTFTKAAKSGLYDRTPDREYYRMLSAVEAISLLWRYEGDQPKDKSTQSRMNVMTLLANAIEMISKMYLLIRQ